MLGYGLRRETDELGFLQGAQSNWGRDKPRRYSEALITRELWSPRECKALGWIRVALAAFLTIPARNGTITVLARALARYSVVCRCASVAQMSREAQEKYLQFSGTLPCGASTGWVLFHRLVAIPLMFALTWH